MAIKVTELLDRLIVEISRDIDRPENRDVRDILQGGVNALNVFRAILEASYPDSLLLPED